MSLLNLTKLTWILLLLCIYFLTLCDASVVEKAVVQGRDVTLTCNTGDITQRIIWRSLLSIDDEYPGILAVCKVNQTNCETTIIPGYHATRQDTVSHVTFLISFDDQPLIYDCMLGTAVVKTFTLTVINVGQIVPPECSISPEFMNGQTDIETVDYTCEPSTLSGLVPHLSVSFGLRGISNVESSLLLKTPLDFNAFKNVSNASCESSLGDLNENRTCSFPGYVHVRHVLKEHDVEFECELESSETSEITWSLIDQYIGYVDIENRSWTRHGRRFMLLQDITGSDVGRIVECKTFTPETPSSLIAVGFDLIHRVPTTSLAPSTKQQEPTSTPNATNKASDAPDENTYIILTVVFILLELITIALIVAFVVYAKICISSSQKGKDQPIRFTSARDDSVRQGTQARGRADIPVIEGNENNSASSSISRTQGSHRSQPPSIDEPIYFSLEAPTTPTTSSTKPHSGRLGSSSNKDYHEDECTDGPRIYEVCDGDGAVGGSRFDKDYGDDYAAGGSRLDDDSVRCRDFSGYDLVKIPSRSPTVDVEDVDDINNGQSVEDISQLYGKVNKNFHS